MLKICKWCKSEFDSRSKSYIFCCWNCKELDDIKKDNNKWLSKGSKKKIKKNTSKKIYEIIET